METDPPDLKNLSEHALSFGSKPAEAMPADPFWGDDLPPTLAAVDERWQNFMVGTKSDLEDAAKSFPLSEQASERVARMLEVSRQLFVHSYFLHEFAYVGATWSMFALEAALKDLLSIPDEDRSGLGKLAGQAHATGLLSKEEFERVSHGGKLRNQLVHAR